MSAAMAIAVRMDVECSWVTHSVPLCLGDPQGEKREVEIDLFFSKICIFH